MDPVINEAIEPEEETVIDNIISLFQQLRSMMSGNQGMTGMPEEPIMEALAPDATVEEEELDVTKAVIDETGDTKAEERLSNVTETTDQSLQDLQKALEGLIGKKRVVRKTQQQNGITAAINKMTALMTTVVKNQQQQEIFNAGMMNAIGFSDDVVKKNMPAPQQNVTKTRPTQSLDTSAVIQQVIEGVFKNMPQLNQNPAQNNAWNNKRGVNKNMQTITKFIGGVK
jgi:hypothetical protein